MPKQQKKRSLEAEVSIYDPSIELAARPYFLGDTAIDPNGKQFVVSAIINRYAYGFSNDRKYCKVPTTAGDAVITEKIVEREETEPETEQLELLFWS